MNYIKQLQEENAELKARLEGVSQDLRHFISFLETSPKFQGLQPDGSRKDWIATSDVTRFLRESLPSI